MMLRQAAAGLQGRAAAQAVKSPLVAVSSVASRKHAAFKPARSSVRAAAAEPEAKEAKAAPAARRERRAVTVDMADVKAGAEFEATVSSVEAYGAFVNFGAEKDGLVHISQLSSGFIKNAGDVVKVGDKVKVKVLSYDATQGRVALTMKGLNNAASEAADDGAADSSMEDYEEEDERAAGSELDMLVAADGYQYVFADGSDYDFPFEMEEEDAELSVESVAAFEDADDADFAFEHSADVDVPIHELVSGKVSRVEEYGIFVTFNHNGRDFTALLEREEAKVPASALSAEDLAEYSQAGELVPAYVDLEVDNVAKYYKVGDAIDAFVLEYNDQGKMALTQYADWEIEAMALGAPLVDEMVEDLKTDGTLSDFSGKEMEVLAMDPLQLVESGEVAAASDFDFGAESAADTNEAVSDVQLGRGGSQYTTGLFTRGGDMVNPTAFPSRPLNKVGNSFALASTAAVDTDFDGDEIYLEDFWQSNFVVPKGALRRLGYKVQFDDKGEAEVVEREGGPEAGAEDELSVFSLGASHEDRVSAFVKELLDGDEDEAELPARMGRVPVVLAMDMATIPAKAVKDLRGKTGAGMMDCKKALAETDGNVDAAIEWLRKKGLSGADKKASRIAAEGAIISYIHPGSRLGVMLEVNCETDFVAASDAFQTLAKGLAMQIAASPQVQYVTVEDIPAEVFEREKQLEMQREDIKAKPENIRAKIAEGRAQKIAQEMALLPQPYLMDGSKTVEQAVKEAIAALGEKISVRRFVKFQLGEGIEKRSNDFAAEVAAATGQK